VGNVGDAAFSSGDIMRRLRTLEQHVRELTAGRRLENATIGAGGIRVTNDGVLRSDTFDGDMSQSDPGLQGWALGRDRLALGGQLVGPVAFDSAGEEQISFSLSTTPTAKATATLTVPPWADEALVLAISSARVVNESAFDDVCFSTVRIAGEDGSEMLGVAAASGASFSLTSVTAQHRRIIVSPASTISCQAMLSTSNSTWSTNVTNRCAIDAIAIYRTTD
jgi:hypothetical protein